MTDREKIIQLMWRGALKSALPVGASDGGTYIVPSLSKEVLADALTALEAAIPGIADLIEGRATVVSKDAQESRFVSDWEVLERIRIRELERIAVAYKASNEAVANASLQAANEEAAEVIARLSIDLAGVRAENDRLRAALANSDQPCAYCSLPADEWSKCEIGFPGCSRADDAMGCPELGASLEAKELRERIKVFGDALKPFAARAALYDPPEPNDGCEADWLHRGEPIRLDDLRAARAALEGGK